jgi:integrase
LIFNLLERATPARLPKQQSFRNAACVGRKPNADTLEIVKGLYLKPQPNSRHLQAHCRLNNQTLRKSMGTEDVEQARLAALEWYFDLKQQAKLGVLLVKISFPHLATEYLRTIPAGAKYRYHADTIERHLLPFFGTFTDIKQIRAGTISDYLVHRRGKREKEPTPQTLNRENTVLRQLLHHAFTQMWIAQPLTVPFLNQSQSLRRRRHFTDDEYRTLLDTAIARIASAHSEPRERHVKQNRQLLYDVIVLLANSGMRVDESKTITWRGVDWAKGDIVLERAGKKKSNRRVILRRSAIQALERIAKRRRDWLSKNGHEPTLDPNERVIALPDGTTVWDFKKAFRDLLADCGFVYTDPKDRHTLTSLRHTYATRLLTRRDGPRVSIRTLTKQMDTSERMINAHYGHDDIEDYRDELNGE